MKLTINTVMVPSIFIVDDDVIFVELLKRKLLLKGQKNIIICNNAETFINSITNTTNLVFLDYNIGNTNGIKILQKINKQIPLCRIIMLSSHDEQEIIDQALELGVEKYIIKGNILMNSEIDAVINNLQNYNPSTTEYITE